MASTRESIVFLAGGIALSALMLYFGTGLAPIWWLTWIAPIPALVVAFRGGSSTAFAAGFGAWFLGELTMWTYLRSVIGLPFLVVVFFMLLPALVFALAAVLAGSLAARGRIAAAGLAVPSVWVGAEYLLSLVSPHGTFGALAYTQMDFLPVVQLASVLGVWGVDFLVLLVPGVVALALSGRGTGRSTVVLGATCAAVVAVALGFGAWRLGAEPQGDEVTIALLAMDAPRSPLPASDPIARGALESYAASLDALGARGASVAVLPETVVSTSGEELAGVRRIFEDVATRRAMYVVVGVDRTDERGERNTALAFTPAGGAPAAYEKRHLLPGAEDQYRPGGALLVVDADPTPRGVAVGSAIGVAICKDLDFPALAREYGARSVGLLLVPAWDFDRDAWLHSRMAVMRGVESGFAIARSARRGALTISDARGRVIAETSSDAAPVATLVASVPIEPVDTLYARFGDWFAWAIVALAAALVVAAVGRRAASHAGDRSPIAISDPTEAG